MDTQGPSYTFIGPGMLVYSIVISILNFILVPNEILGGIYYFNLPIFLIYSYSSTCLGFISDSKYKSVLIMLLGNGCRFYLFTTYMYFIYISLTNTIRKEPSSGGRIKGVEG